MTTESKTPPVYPQAQETLGEIRNWLDSHPEETTGSYGHAVGLLGQVIANTSVFETEEEQRAHLREKAELIIEKYGPNIIDFMRPELREALGIESKSSENSSSL